MPNVYDFFHNKTLEKKDLDNDIFTFIIIICIALYFICSCLFLKRIGNRRENEYIQTNERQYILNNNRNYKKNINTKLKDIIIIFKKPIYEDDNNKSLECSICYDKFIEQQNIVKTKCKHLYCVKCIKKWLLKNNNCPICRDIIIK